MLQLLTEILTFKTNAFFKTRQIYKNNEQSKNEPRAKTNAIIADTYIETESTLHQNTISYHISLIFFRFTLVTQLTRISFFPYNSVHLGVKTLRFPLALWRTGRRD